jgi:hypothetical protein
MIPPRRLLLSTPVRSTLGGGVVVKKFHKRPAGTISSAKGVIMRAQVVPHAASGGACPVPNDSPMHCARVTSIADPAPIRAHVPGILGNGLGFNPTQPNARLSARRPTSEGVIRCCTLFGNYCAKDERICAVTTLR